MSDDGLGGQPRYLVAAEEKGNDDGAGGEHCHIFTHKKDGEFHGAVFDMIACDDFTLTFGQIEGRPVCLGKGGNDKDDCPQRAAIPHPTSG